MSRPTLAAGNLKQAGFSVLDAFVFRGHVLRDPSGRYYLPRDTVRVGAHPYQAREIVATLEAGQ